LYTHPKLPLPSSPITSKSAVKRDDETPADGSDAVDADAAPEKKLGPRRL
jgi:hypothetical protein